MPKMSQKHDLTFKKDPIMDRKAMIEGMKTFKNSSYPSNPFKDAKPKTDIDEFYTPHKNKVPR